MSTLRTSAEEALCLKLLRASIISSEECLGLGLLS